MGAHIHSIQYKFPAPSIAQGPRYLPFAMAEQEPETLTIYKACRTIKKRNNTLYNSLRSIYEDSLFVNEIASIWPEVPLVANLRCGLWYSQRFDATCYFKSTDGHTGNWSFSTSRLNLHLAELAAQRGGCIIVDSTRRGKRFPDSMSKTIPIWTCVLNRAIKYYFKDRSKHNMIEEQVSNNCLGGATDMKDVSQDWDCSLHLPLWVSKTEKAAIENYLDEWMKLLEASGADLTPLVNSLEKPLRPLWISQRTVIWLNEVPDYDSWNFTPIILVSASCSMDRIQQKCSSEYSWHYIAGAGDDEESWARGLTPSLFWRYSFDLIHSGPDMCNQKVADIVEKDRVYRTQRGATTVQVKLKPQKLLTSDIESTNAGGSNSYSQDNCENLKKHDNCENLKIHASLKSSRRDCPFYWLGSTNLAVGAADQVNAVKDVDCLLICGSISESLSLPSTDAYLCLPIVVCKNSKMDRFSLLSNLPSAVKFAQLNLNRGKRILVCCDNGEDISVCVCLAILTSLFDERGVYNDGEAFKQMCITKWEMRRRLVYICKFAINARPSRGNLKQVYSFLSQDKTCLPP
ncbi:tRNA A64-2'-O-ribosylphosphate transferase isoform X2 [Amborella trichopoda]|uniref:tRNA A64-2'-O-ribosylphosphate transferase isoform X2 n=1 Tax=Amborella trichopoda TaxID=13333 RepID=UPI0009C125A0|nr:tRNA A64-2'-O-ribosylphosphate transferase isoform X2 [Amborella trichopoda]|eukprot:XP_020528618.1 tRNA A64-2'-O-ribosylphosphate transferase isoform X2 [Amborella trichopoda]